MTLLADDPRLSLPTPLEAFDLKDCQAFVTRLAALWCTRDVEANLALFTEGAEVEYADLAPIKGKAAIRKLLEARFGAVAEYHLQKTARLASKPRICVDLDIRWSAVDAPKVMRRSRAFEILTIDANSKIAKWELVSNPHPVGL